MSVSSRTSSESRRVHLLRHGEVDNPTRINYGRLDGFGLSARGQRSAQAAATHLRALGRRVGAVHASPLLRTIETAQGVAALLRTRVVPDERLIESWSVFEGRRSSRAWADPRIMRVLLSPQRVAAEPATQVLARVLDVVLGALAHAHGDVVLVTHQRPIWLLHRFVAQAPLTYHPWRARCAPGSITSFVDGAAGLCEIDYWEPGALTSVGTARGSRRGTQR